MPLWFFFFGLFLILDPGKYNTPPHDVVANLAAFFELWDTFLLQWVKSTQVMVSDEKLYEVSGPCKLFCANFFVFKNCDFSFFLSVWISLSDPHTNP